MDPERKNRSTITSDSFGLTVTCAILASPPLLAETRSNHSNSFKHKICGYHRS